MRGRQQKNMHPYNITYYNKVRRIIPSAMWYSPLTGAALQQQQIGHNSTWLWVSPIPAAPLSLVHLHRSEKQLRKEKTVKQKTDEDRWTATVGVSEMDSNWPAAWPELSPRWPAWPGPKGWTLLPGGAWAMCTLPPLTCTWHARYLTDKDITLVMTKGAKNKGLNLGLLHISQH